MTNDRIATSLSEIRVYGRPVYAATKVVQKFTSSDVRIVVSFNNFFFNLCGSPICLAPYTES